VDESTPADVVTGQVPVADEGQKPDQPETPPEQGQEPEQERKYSEAYVKELRKEAADRRQQVASLEERLQELEDADKSEQEKLTERLTKRERELEESTTKLLRFEIASEHGLDLSAAKFLSGSTREEMELRAEELTQLLQDKAKAKPAAGFDGGARRRAPEQKTPEEAHQDLLLTAFGRQPRAS